MNYNNPHRPDRFALDVLLAYLRGWVSVEAVRAACEDAIRTQSWEGFEHERETLMEYVANPSKFCGLGA